MTYQIPDEIKQDPVKRWNLSDRAFFACGACHILAHVFLQRFPELGFYPVWIRPHPGFRGNHVYVTDNENVFDWRGFSLRANFLSHISKRYCQKYPGWNADLVRLSVDLTSRDACLSIGMNTRGADQYLYDPIPRACRYLNRFDIGICISDDAGG